MISRALRCETKSFLGEGGFELGKFSLVSAFSVWDDVEYWYATYSRDTIGNKWRWKNMNCTNLLEKCLIILTKGILMNFLDGVNLRINFY